MKTRFFLFLALSFFLQVSRADIIIDGNVTWVDNINITEDIVIQNGGELTINCIVTMGHPAPGSEMVKIIVENGGRLVSDPNVSGGVNSLAPDKFEGIVVEGTMCKGGNEFIALELDNFFIEGASSVAAALFIKTSITGNQGTEPVVNSRILVKNTQFLNCNAYVKSEFSMNNHLNSCNNVVFINCDFEDSVVQDWPLHIFRLSELTFLNCNFHMSGAWALHSMFNQNVTVKGCTFSNSRRGLIFHGTTNNLIIEDNTFIANNEQFTTLAIGIGAAVASGNIVGGKIANNTFSDFKVGISIADNTNQINGTAGSITDVEIFGNSFCNNKIGIQSGRSLDCKFNDNNFSNCDTGILLNSKVIDGVEEGNVNPGLHCNLFEDCDVSIDNDDNLVDEFFSEAVGTDPQNRFFGDGVDIQNSTTNMFIYHRYFQPYPGRVDNTVNVSVTNSPLLGQCKRLEWEVNCKNIGMKEANPSSSAIAITKNLKISSNLVFPNPTTDRFVNVKLGKSGSQLIIYDSSGRIVKSYSNLNEGELHNLDLTTLSIGVYFIQINSSSESSIHKLILN